MYQTASGACLRQFNIAVKEGKLKLATDKCGQAKIADCSGKNRAGAGSAWELNRYRLSFLGT
jgi:hypothetical protein